MMTLLIKFFVGFHADDSSHYLCCETTLSHLCILVPSGYSLSVCVMLTVSLAKVNPLFGRHPSELSDLLPEYWAYIRN